MILLLPVVEVEVEVAATIPMDKVNKDMHPVAVMVVALDKTYGLKITDPETARRVLENVTTMCAAVAQHQALLAGLA